MNSIKSSTQQASIHEPESHSQSKTFLKKSETMVVPEVHEEDFNTSDPVKFAKAIKGLATVTDHDILAHKRQKQGQLRIGDVIMLAFHEDVFQSQIDQDRYNTAM